MSSILVSSRIAILLGPLLGLLVGGVVPDASLDQVPGCAGHILHVEGPDAGDVHRHWEIADAAKHLLGHVRAVAGLLLVDFGHLAEIRGGGLYISYNKLDLYLTPYVLYFVYIFIFSRDSLGWPFSAVFRGKSEIFQDSFSHLALVRKS